MAKRRERSTETPPPFESNWVSILFRTFKCHHEIAKMRSELERKNISLNDHAHAHEGSRFALQRQVKERGRETNARKEGARAGEKKSENPVTFSQARVGSYWIPEGERKRARQQEADSESYTTA